MLQKWRHKNRSTVFILTAANSERDLSHEQKSFGDVITAEHKILNEGRESWNNHRYAVVVQVLVTQWNPCQTKTSQETEKNLRKFLVSSQKPKVIHTNDSVEFGKPCEESSWNHRTATPSQVQRQGIAERPVRRVQEETSVVLLQSGLNEKWWSDSMKCSYYLRNVQNLLADGKSQNEQRSGESSKGPIILFGALVGYPEFLKTVEVGQYFMTKHTDGFL